MADGSKVGYVRGRTIRVGPYLLDDRWLLRAPLPTIEKVVPTPSQMRAPARPTPPGRLADAFTVGPVDPRARGRLRRRRPNRRRELGLAGRPSEGETPPPPRRITSLGNGLILDWKVTLPEAVVRNPFWDEGAPGYDANDLSTWTPREPLHHAVGLEATLRRTADGFYSWGFTTAWYADDDNGWACYGQTDLLASAIDDGEWLNDGYRILCLAPAVSGDLRPEALGDDPDAEWSFGLIYCAVAIQDDWGPRGRLVEEWAIEKAVHLENLPIVMEYWRGKGFRPISIRGVGVPYARGSDAAPEFVRCPPSFALVLVRDNIGADEWKVIVDLAPDDFVVEQQLAWDQGYRTISLSAYNNEGELRYTAVVVRDTSGVDGGPSADGEWEYRAEMDADEFDERNENYRRKGWQIVTCACHPRKSVPEGFGISEPKNLRFSAVWRKYAPRRLTVAPGAYARDQAMFDLFSGILPEEMALNRTGAAALTIMRDGEMLFSAAYTWAPEGNPMMTRETPIRLGSVSKSLTTLGVLKMIDDGIQVTLKDGTVRDIDFDLEVFRVQGMPDFPVNLPEAPDVDMSWAYEQLTLGRLLNQQSGFISEYPLTVGDYDMAERLPADLPLTHIEVQEYAEHPGVWPSSDPEVELGLKDSIPVFLDASPPVYSNPNYICAEWFINAALGPAGIDYAGYLRDRVFAPLGLLSFRPATTSRIDCAVDEPTYAVQRVKYRNDASLPISDEVLEKELSRSTRGDNPFAFPWKPTLAYGSVNLERLYAVGGWVSTADDLAALLDGLASWQDEDLAPAGGSSVIRAETLARIFGATPVEWGPSSRWAGGSDYILGWYVLNQGGFGVAGSTDGSVGIGLFRPHGLVAALVANSSTGAQGTRAIVETALQFV